MNITSVTFAAVALACLFIVDGKLTQVFEGDIIKYVMDPDGYYVAHQTSCAIHSIPHDGVIKPIAFKVPSVLDSYRHRDISSPDDATCDLVPIDDSMSEEQKIKTIKENKKRKIMCFREAKFLFINHPGTIELHRNVFNMMSQYLPGEPSDFTVSHGTTTDEKWRDMIEYGWDNGILQKRVVNQETNQVLVAGECDSKSDRLNWFRLALKRIALVMLNRNGIEKPMKIAFPGLIGCGLAKGYWPTYLKMIEEWSEKYGIDTTIVYFDKEEKIAEIMSKPEQ
jgi:hypothetical protein